MPDTDEGGLSPAILHEILIEARSAGFLGPGPVEPHLLHAAGFVRLARTQPNSLAGAAIRILDLGSGGGLPGLVIAAEWPAASLVLLDANERRCEFLRRAVLRCQLESRVSVVHQRAEECGHDPDYRGTFDGVVVRSFGPPAVVVECGAPFLRVGGWLIVSEPPESSQNEASRTRWPADRIAQVGLEPGELAKDDFGYQVLYQRERCPDRFPRRNGVPAKNPLF